MQTDFETPDIFKIFILRPFRQAIVIALIFIRFNKTLPSTRASSGCIQSSVEWQVC